VVNFIEFNCVIVSTVENSAVRVVKNQIMPGLDADTIKTNCGNITTGPSALFLKDAILDNVATGF
jgi:hypothetical protein